MPTGGMWKRVVLGELTLNAPPIPGVTHILQGSGGRGAGDWKSQWALPGWSGAHSAERAKGQRSCLHCSTKGGNFHEIAEQ